MTLRELTALDPVLGPFLADCQRAGYVVDVVQREGYAVRAYVTGKPFADRSKPHAAISWAPDHPRQHRLQVRPADADRFIDCTTLANVQFLLDLPRR